MIWSVYGKGGTTLGRPGIMIYFDILEPVRILTDSERGKLLTAILEYGKEGKEPSFTGKLALAWSFVRPKIDLDGDRYNSVVEKRKYAGFCSSLSRKNLEMVSFEDWQEMDEAQMKRMLTGNRQQKPTHADIREPTANTATTTKTNTDTYTTATADAEQDASLEAAAAAEKKKLRKITGPLGQGVVNLSEEQIEMLLDKMDLDMFDYYVSKLADFILRSGATVKNHYATILKWWTQDSAC